MKFHGVYFVLQTTFEEKPLFSLFTRTHPTTHTIYKTVLVVFEELIFSPTFLTLNTNSYRGYLALLFDRVSLVINTIVSISKQRKV